MTPATAAHTPGEWTYDYAPESGHASEFMVLGPRNSVLAYVGADESRDVIGPTVEANARLMTAAPALLMWLEFALRRLTDCGLSDHATDEITRVIAKAKGRQP